MDKIINFDPKKKKCSCCKKRLATRLCDAPIARARYIGHQLRFEILWTEKCEVDFNKVEMSHTITCDRPICDNCSTRVSDGIDYCPECLRRIKTINH